MLLKRTSKVFGAAGVALSCSWLMPASPAEATVVITPASTSGSTVAAQQNFDANITNINPNTDLVDVSSPYYASMATSGTTNGNGSTAFSGLNDGQASTKVSSNNLANDTFFANQADLAVTASATYNFNLTINPQGYDISTIRTINGWADTQTFSDQQYTVSYEPVNSTVFTPLTTVSYVPFTSDNGTNPQTSSMVTINSTTGTLIKNVAAIRFNFASPLSTASGSVVREVEAIGQPSITAAPAAPAPVATILPLGDSITWGDSSAAGAGTGHGLYPISGGYRTSLYNQLTQANFAFNFVGSQTTNPSATLTSANQINQEGHNAYTIDMIKNNLDGSDDTAGTNNGGYWLTGGHGTGRSAIYPTYILREIGTNNLTANESLSGMESDLNALLSSLTTLRPQSNIMLSSVIPRTIAAQNNEAILYNSYIQNTLVPQEQALGLHVYFVDQYDNFVNSDGSINTAMLPTPDGTHPSQLGQNAMGQTWATAILAVPEPGSGTIIAIGGLLLSSRRRGLTQNRL